MDRHVGVHQQPIVGRDDVAIALGGWQRNEKLASLLREVDRDAATKESVHFGVSSGRDAKQDHLGDALGIPLGIGER